LSIAVVLSSLHTGLVPRVGSRLRLLVAPPSTLRPTV